MALQERAGMGQQGGSNLIGRLTALGIRGKTLALAGLGLCALPCVLLILIWRDIVLVAGLAPLLAIGSATLAAIATLIGLDLILRPVSQTGTALGRLLGGTAPADLPQQPGGPAGRLMHDAQRVIDELIALRAEHIDGDDRMSNDDRAGMIAALQDSPDPAQAVVVLRLGHARSGKGAADGADHVLAEMLRRLRAQYGQGLCVGQIGQADLAFALPLPHADLAATPEFEQALQGVLDSLGRPVLCDAQHISPDLRAGVATRVQGDAPELAFDNALAAVDTAWLAAPLVFFSGAVRDQADDLVALEQQLQRAIRNEEFELYYQPVVDLSAQCPLGAEALIRWHSPTRGFVPPGMFIPLAEASGLIDPIGLWVLREACREAATWDPALRVAINLGARQFLDEDLTWHVSEAITAAGIRPDQLEIELTESVAMVDCHHTKATFTALRDMGVQIAIDDFGTGHANMRTLRKLPFTTLKIDREFVADVHRQAGSLAICDALIALGAGLGLNVVAEGTEKAEEVAVLSRRGCSLFQGYYFARPVPAQVLGATYDNLWLRAAG